MQHRVPRVHVLDLNGNITSTTLNECSRGHQKIGLHAGTRLQRHTGEKQMDRSIVPLCGSQVAHQLLRSRPVALVLDSRSSAECFLGHPQARSVHRSNDLVAQACRDLQPFHQLSPAKFSLQIQAPTDTAVALPRPLHKS